MPLSSLQAAILSLVTTAASIAVGFGVLSSTTEGVIVSIAGTVIAAVFQVATELHRKTATAAKVAGVTGKV
jgi:hypothetical protein